MKLLAAGALMLALTNPASAQTWVDQANETCTWVTKFAGLAMIYRQTGTEFVDAMKSADGLDLYEAMIYDAYQWDVYSTSEAKTAAIEKFKKSISDMCWETHFDNKENLKQQSGNL